MILSLLLAFTLPLNPMQQWRQLGNKSLEMYQELNEGVLSEYEKSDHSFFYQKQKYQIVSGQISNFSEIPSVFIGSYPTGREIIALDPKNSPILDQLYRGFIKHFSTFSSTEQIFNLLIEFINEKVFISELCNESQLCCLINQWCFSRERTQNDFANTIDGDLVPVIPIDHFIYSGVGICRQFSFTAAYFIDRLIKEGYLDGKVFIVRDFVGSRMVTGGHAWNLFLSNDGLQAWHVDSFWKILANCFDSDNVRELVSLYGDSAIENQKMRFFKND